MSDAYTNFSKEKLSALLNPAKPKSPDYSQEANLTKGLIDLDEHFGSQLRNEGSKASMEMAERWKHKGGGNPGDAFIEGLQSGLRKGSILDDKKRTEKYKSGLEKMKGMVEQTNLDLAKQERLYNAKQDAAPKVLWFSQNMNNMPPADADAYARRFINEFGDISGANLDYLGMDSLQKNKWMVRDKDTGEERVFDILQETLPAEVAQQRLLETMPEYQKEMNVLKADHASQQEAMNLDKQLKREKIDVIRQEHKDLQSYKEAEDSIRQDTGDSVISLDRYHSQPSLKKHYEQEITKMIEKGSSANTGLHALDRLEEIVTQKPQLFATFDALISNKNSSDPTLLSTIATKLKVKDEDRADFEEANKLLAILYQQTLHALPAGTRPNQYLEKELKKGIPSLNQVPEAFRRVVGHWRKDLSHPSDVGKKASYYRELGFKYNPKIKEYTAPVKLPTGEKVTPAELRAKDPRLNEFTDEELREWAKSKGSQ